MTFSIRNSSESHFRNWLAALPLLSALAAGCDAQSTPQYQGEALFSLHGSVEIEDSDLDGPLIPAFAFFGEDGMHIVDVDVHGKFPSSFTLDVYTPPDTDVDTAQLYFPEEPGMALGFITAVPADHASFVPLATNVSGSQGATTARGSESSSTWCTRSGDCYTETVFCKPGQSADGDTCEITDQQGNPELKRGIYASFAGLSENFVVAYLRHPAAPYSVTAHFLGAGKTGLDAGYHLIKVAKATEAEDMERAQCIDDVYDLSIERVNDTHEVHLKIGDNDTYGCDDVSLPCDQKRADDFSRLLRKVEAELDCPSDDYNLTLVANDERISVRIGKDAHLTSDD